MEIASGGTELSLANLCFHLCWNIFGTFTIGDVHSISIFPIVHQRTKRIVHFAKKITKLMERNRRKEILADLTGILGAHTDRMVCP